MNDEKIINSINADYIGEPGNRRFYILVSKKSDAYLLWIEKDQLISLGRACSKLLSDHVTKIEKSGKYLTNDIELPDDPDIEMNVIRIGVDYLTASSRIVIIFDDQESIENGESPKLRIEIERKLIHNFINQTRELSASGRPTCPLCHEVVDENGNCNFCPKKNGHSKDADIPKLI
tara:strand:+ start:938 stop:1465 length:528 start_codon:yes stop_codon:yes gene_type:complete